MDMRKIALLAAGSLLGAGLLTGCGPDARDLPLPGTTVPGKSFIINAEFEDALNLAIGAKVKVNGIDVGRVKDVTNKGFHAIAFLRVKQDANIHEGATARLRYNTPLGELFVDIRSPKTGTLLKDGDSMVPPVTSTAPTVEDALASASLLINGGGLEQLQTITQEFQKAVGQRGPTIRQLLERTDNFLTEANATTGDIDRALTALASASTVLNQRQDIINRAVQEITPAARVIRENTDQVVALLQEAVKLARKANGLVGASRTQLLSTIRELGPVLDEFYSLRGRFRSGLNDLANLADLFAHVIPGDFGPVEGFVNLGKTKLVARTTTSGGTTKSSSTTANAGVLQGLGLPPNLLQSLGLPALPGLGRASTTGVSR
jgi:phospholipid/cholesterol/gamma-HCH transport system substrate-binding protein